MHKTSHTILRLLVAAAPLLLVGAALAVPGGEGGHGGDHHAHIANWWSLDSEINSHAPALGHVIITFLAFVGLLFMFVKKPLSNFLISRSEQVERAIREAEIAKKAAEEKQREYEEKLRSLDDEVETMRQEFKTRGEEERRRMEQAGERAAERVLKDAQDTIAAELERAQQALKEEAARLALQTAEDRIKKAINDDDEARLRKDFLAQIAG